MPLPNPFEPGHRLTAADLNAIVNSIVSRVSGGEGMNVRKFGDKIIVESNAPAAPIGLADRWFVIVSVEKDIENNIKKPCVLTGLLI